MYKQSDIISKDEIETLEDDVCKCCTLHEKAYKFFKEKQVDNLTEDTLDLCPICNERLDTTAYGYEGHIVVGGHNDYTENENIGYYSVRRCKHCDKEFAMMPIEIEYNANHDIFYTGGSYFLSETDEKLLMDKINEVLIKTTKQFVKRVKNGEELLNDWNLQYWNRNALEHVISEFLFERGLKK